MLGLNQLDSDSHIGLVDLRFGVVVENVRNGKLLILRSAES